MERSQARNVASMANKIGNHADMIVARMQALQNMYENEDYNNVPVTSMLDRFAEVRMFMKRIDQVMVDMLPQLQGGQDGDTRKKV